MKSYHSYKCIIIGMMASRFFVELECWSHKPSGPMVPMQSLQSMASGSGVPVDGKKVYGLERKVMMAEQKGLDPYNMLAPKASSGTKEVPNLVPSITKKQ